MPAQKASYRTPVSLLQRLQNCADDCDWQRFVDLYTPLLFSWTQRLKLPRVDAADLLQDVFLLLFQKLNEFETEQPQRFRAWLWVVFLNKARERLRRPDLLAEAVALNAEDPLTAPGDLEQWIEADYRHYLIGEAIRLMRSEFSEPIWRACWETTVNERTVAEVGRELGMTENAVYQARSRVLRRLRHELDGLLD